MTMLASQITSLPVVCSIVYSDVNQRKHQSSASLAFVREIHRGPVNFPHKWPVTRKMFPFDDVITSIQYPNQLGEMSYSVTVVSCAKKHHNQLYQMQTYDVRNTPQETSTSLQESVLLNPPPPQKKKEKKKKRKNKEKTKKTTKKNNKQTNKNNQPHTQKNPHTKDNNKTNKTEYISKRMLIFVRWKDDEHLNWINVHAAT